MLRVCVYLIQNVDIFYSSILYTEKGRYLVTYLFEHKLIVLRFTHDKSQNLKYKNSKVTATFILKSEI